MSTTDLLLRFKRQARSLLGPNAYHAVRSLRHINWASYDLFALIRYRARLPTLMLGGKGLERSIVPHLLNSDSIVYSFGVGDDLLFERQLVERFGLTVHAFDPTPRALAWADAQDLPGIMIHRIGIAGYDGRAHFAAPPRPDWVSFSMARAPGASGGLDAPVRRLQTIMGELGHNRVDLLKLDIEGAEYQVLSDLLKSRVFPRQIVVEFHHRFHEVPHRWTRGAIRELGGAGYRIVYVSREVPEVTFVQPNVQISLSS